MTDEQLDAVEAAIAHLRWMRERACLTREEEPHFEVLCDGDLVAEVRRLRAVLRDLDELAETSPGEPEDPLSPGTECWWAQYTGRRLTAFVRVRVLDQVEWAPGVFVRGDETGRSYNVDAESLVALDRLNCDLPFEREVSRG